MYIKWDYKSSCFVRFIKTNSVVSAVRKVYCSKFEQNLFFRVFFSGIKIQHGTGRIYLPPGSGKVELVSRIVKYCVTILSSA